MQRIEDNALIVSCDFCATDWNGAAPVIEGHRGSIICLECLKRALGEMKHGEGKFNCVLCLREGIAENVDRWEHQNRPGVFACKSCVLQAADVFDRDPDVEWTWHDKSEVG